MAKGDFRGPRDYYSGRMNERDALGEFQRSPAFVKAYRAAANERGYTNYHDSMSLVVDHYQGDPTNPTKPLARELRMAVIEELGLEDDADMDRIKFYSALGTPLDVFHGVDAWIEFIPENGVPRRVTIDVTLDPSKETHKADVIIQEVPDPSENEKRFLKIVYENYGPQLADKLRPAVQMMMRRREQEKPLAAK